MKYGASNGAGESWAESGAGARGSERTQFYDNFCRSCVLDRDHPASGTSDPISIHLRLGSAPRPPVATALAVTGPSCCSWTWRLHAIVPQASVYGFRTRTSALSLSTLPSSYKELSHKDSVRSIDIRIRHCICLRVFVPDLGPNLPQPHPAVPPPSRGTSSATRLAALARTSQDTPQPAPSRTRPPGLATRQGHARGVHSDPQLWREVLDAPL